MSKGTSPLPFRRIAVIGCPGSGKSVLSRVLRDKTGISLHHLDSIYWHADGTHIPSEELVLRVRAILQADSWIMDGNYASSVEDRIAAAELVILLDYPTEVCLAGAEARKGHAHSDLPFIETGDEEFLQYIRNFKTDTLPRMLAILEKYPHTTVYTFRSREEADAFLRSL